MKSVAKIAALTVLLLGAACNSEQANGSAAGSGPAKPVAAPNGGDWTKTVRQTPEGGYLMGNPDAAVKLVEFGSLTCPHCADFARLGEPKLIDNYVKSGRVSYEFRNFVRDPYDLAASLVARCGGTKSFFPLNRALFVDQAKWIGKLQSVPPAQAQALQSATPPQQMRAIASWAGFPQWAAQRGLPSAKLNACLANEQEINKLVQMNSEAVSSYSIPGTPAFLINGTLAEDATTWQTLEPKIRKALGG
jgi:protein-disulfide isomerase